MTPVVNVPDVALIFEGGGMRAAYTSAVVVELLKAGLVFPFVAGISAGASNTANYLAGDGPRAKASFTTFAADPRFGGLGTFVRGQGFFNADYIYQHTSAPDEALPYDFDRFVAHPAEMSLTAFRCRDGATVRWSKRDIGTMGDLMVRVQASSTMPVLMPPVTIDDEVYVDGALVDVAGVVLPVLVPALEPLGQLGESPRAVIFLRVGCCREDYDACVRQFVRTPVRGDLHCRGGVAG